MLGGLPRESRPRIVRLSRAASTMDVAARLARLGWPPWTIVLAEEQSRGRGRRGHSWASPRGGLWMSLILPGGDPVGWQYVLGGAVATALEGLGAPVEVRWPNDVYAAGGKLAGVIVECGDGCVGGVGVNVFNEPPTPRAVSLSRLGLEVGIEELALRVAGAAETLHRSGGALRVVNRLLYRGPAWVAVDGSYLLCRPAAALADGLLALCPGGVRALRFWEVERVYYP